MDSGKRDLYAVKPTIVNTSELWTPPIVNLLH